MYRGLFCEAVLVAADGLGKAHVEGVADECVAYRHLVEVGDRLREVAEILQAEVVAGVDTEARFVGGARGGYEGGDGLLGVGEEIVGVGLGLFL